MSKQIERVKCDSKQRNLKFIYNKKILSRVIAYTHTHTHIYIYATTSLNIFLSNMKFDKSTLDYKFFLSPSFL